MADGGADKAWVDGTAHTLDKGFFQGNARIAYGLAHPRYSDAEDGEGHHDEEEEDATMQDSGALLTASRSADEAVDVTSKFGARGQCDPLLLSVFFFFLLQQSCGGEGGLVRVR